MGAALALHVACALCGYRWARQNAAEPDVASVAPTEIELSIDEEQSRDFDRKSATDLDVAPSSVAVVTEARARDPRKAPSMSDSPANGEVAGNATARESSGVEDGYALDPGSAGTDATASPGASVQLGIGAGDWARYVDPMGQPTVDVPERGKGAGAPASSTGGLAEALEAHDQSIGIGPAGAVLTAVHQAGYSEIAPALGVATFSVTILSSGAVDVKLTGVSSNEAAWSKVGDKIAAAIRKKPPHIPSSRSGVRLGIEVVAEERWPNGQATRSDHGPQLALRPPKFQMTEAAREELLDRNPAAVPGPDAPRDKPPLQANVETPGVFVEGQGKVCSYRVGLSLIPISGGCDPANIGQPARRVVSTRVLNQTLF
jgi:hypothetical protein